MTTITWSSQCLEVSFFSVLLTYYCKFIHKTVLVIVGGEQILFIVTPCVSLGLFDLIVTLHASKLIVSVFSGLFELFLEFILYKDRSKGAQAEK